jgi:hypothetical protein
MEGSPPFLHPENVVVRLNYSRVASCLCFDRLHTATRPPGFRSKQKGTCAMVLEKLGLNWISCFLAFLGRPLANWLTMESAEWSASICRPAHHQPVEIQEKVHSTQSDSSMASGNSGKIVKLENMRLLQGAKSKLDNLMCCLKGVYRSDGPKGCASTDAA